VIVGIIRRKTVPTRASIFGGMLAPRRWIRWTGGNK